VSLYVVDASVAAKWFFPEELSDRAAALLDRASLGAVDLIAPELLIYELGSVGLKKLRAGQAKPAEIEAALRSLTILSAQLVSSASLVSPALSIATGSEASLYDAVYLVTAREYGGILLTHDAALLRQARELEMSEDTMALADLPL